MNYKVNGSRYYKRIHEFVLIDLLIIPSARSQKLVLGQQGSRLKTNREQKEEIQMYLDLNVK